MPPSPRRLTMALLCAAALVTAGCGSSDNAGTQPPPEPKPSAEPAAFPAADGNTVQDLQAQVPEGPILAPSVSVLRKGKNRFGFALFDTARKQLAGAAVAVYTAREDGTGLEGPFVARSESLAVKPQFESETTATDPDSAKSVYVAELPFRTDGKHVVTALARLDGRMVGTNASVVSVGGLGGPPLPGEKAVRVHTPTVAEAGGDLSRISTRKPPAKDLHEVDFADALGRKPTVITFATPLLCASRLCGPVVDIVEEVKATAPKGVAFVHMEIYNENQVDKGFRPQVGRWRLPTEPWTFVIDRTGKVSTAFEGAFSVGELQRAVAKVA